MSGVQCTRCGEWNLPASRWCSSCRSSLTSEPSPPEPPAQPLASPGGQVPSWNGSAGATPWGSSDPLSLGGGSGLASEDIEVTRTRTGIILLVVGSALAWIPVVNLLGGLLALIGTIQVFRGRDGFPDPHPRNAVAGGALIVVGIILTVLAALVFAGAVVSIASPGTRLTPSEFGAQLTGALQGLVVVLLIAALLVSLGHMLLVYALADPPTRGLLIAGFVLATFLGVVTSAIVLSSLDTAIQQSTSGPTLDLAPIRALQAQLANLGLLAIFPDAVFAYAYYRIWCRIDAEGSGWGAPPASPTGF